MSTLLFEILGNLLLVIILWRAIAGGMLRQYPAFYVYMSYILASSISQLALKTAYGKASDAYYYAYYLPAVLSSGLLIWVLLDIYVRVVRNTRSSWPKLDLPAVLIGTVAFGSWLGVLTIPHAGFFTSFQTVTLPLLAMIVLVVLYRLASAHQ